MTPVSWSSKKQSTVGISVDGAEPVAMKVAIEIGRGLRYKIFILGIPLTGPTYMHGDNMSIINNTQRPESTLKKNPTPFDIIQSERV